MLSIRFSRWFLLIFLLSGLLVLYVGCQGQEEDSSNGKKQEAEKELLWQQGLEFFFEKGRRAEAYQQLSTLQERYPDFDESYFHFILGEIEWRWHNYPVAIQHFLQEVGTWGARHERPFPQKSDLFWYIADAHHQMGLLCKGFFTTALNIERNYYDFLFSLNTRREQRVSTSELTLLPYQEDFILFFRGLCHFYLGERDKARRDWDMLPPSSKLYSRTRAMMGLLAFREGRVEEAERVWEELGEEGKAQGEPGIALLLTGAEPWRSRGLAQLAPLHGKPAAHVRVGVYYAWGLTRETDRLDEAGQILDSVDFAEPELRQQWGKLVPVEGESIEYYVNFYDPFWLNVLADFHLRAATRYYRRYAQEAPRPGVEAYEGAVALALGETDAARTLFETLRNSPEQKLRLGALLGLRVISLQQGDTEKVESVDRHLKDMFVQDPAYRSDYGRLLVEMGESPELGAELCYTPEIQEPGVFSLNMAYVRFVQGMEKQDMDLLTRSIEAYEKNHRMETQYSVRQNDPIVLQGLANACYGRRWFNFGPKIYLKFREMYPQVEQIFNCLRHTTLIWEILKWDKETVFRIEWVELPRQREIWYSPTLKEILDSELTP